MHEHPTVDVCGNIQPQLQCFLTLAPLHALAAAPQHVRQPTSSSETAERWGLLKKSRTAAGGRDCSRARRCSMFLPLHSACAPKTFVERVWGLNLY